jgi:hypothetical protein
MKQTAVEWLYNNLKSHFEHDGDLLEVVQFSFEQAKEMEKQQQEEDMKEAFFEGWIARDGKLTFTKAKNKWFKELKENKI